MRILLLVTMVVACGCRSAPRQEPVVDFDRQAEAKAVYEAAIRHLWMRDGVQHAVINPEGHSGMGLVMPGQTRRHLPRLRTDTWNDYRLQSEHHYREVAVPRDLDVGAPITWFTDAEFQALVEEAEKTKEPLSLETAWDTLRKRYPKWSGWISVGAIGFSRDGRQALTDTSAGFAGLSMSGHVVLLEKRGGVWRVVKEYVAVMA